MESSLAVACAGDDVKFLQRMLSFGSPVNLRGSNGWTPLLTVADGGFVKCVQLLLDNGANPNAAATDNVGMTALIAAAYKGHLECLKVLLDHGASVNAKTKGGLTALIAAADSAEGCNGACVQALLEAGGEVNAKTTEGTTALIHAVNNNYAKVVEILLDGGSEVNAVDGKGYSALHYGAQKNSVESIRVLLDRGADQTRKYPPGHSPLEMAPGDSEGAHLLEKSWKKLELVVALQAEELLHQDELERQSSVASPKPRKKKKSKKKQKKVVEELTSRDMDAFEDPEEKIQADRKQVETGGASMTEHEHEETVGAGKTEHDETVGAGKTELEETLMKRVERLEFELEQAQEEMKQLEVLQEVQILELETTKTVKTEMKSRISDLEVALNILEVENARLKLQLRRSTSLFGVGVGLGSSIVRSASESCLQSMECGTEPLITLPFIPNAGPRTDTNNWFSLVPSPEPDE